MKSVVYTISVFFLCSTLFACTKTYTIQGEIDGCSAGQDSISKVVVFPIGKVLTEIYDLDILQLIVFLQGIIPFSASSNALNIIQLHGKLLEILHSPIQFRFPWRKISVSWYEKIIEAVISINFIFHFIETNKIALARFAKWMMKLYLFAMVWLSLVQIMISSYKNTALEVVWSEKIDGIVIEIRLNFDNTL